MSLSSSSLPATSTLELRRTLSVMLWMEVHTGQLPQYSSCPWLNGR